MRLRQVSIAAGILRGEPFFIGDCLFDSLLRAGAGFEECLLADTLRASARHIRLRPISSRPCSYDLSARLIDAREGTFDPCFLKGPLAPVVFNGRFCCLNSRSGLRQLGSVIVIVELNQDVSLMNLLVVVDLYFANQT
jgi:hypothetical protein